MIEKYDLGHGTTSALKPTHVNSYFQMMANEAKAITDPISVLVLREDNIRACKQGATIVLRFI